GGIRSQYAHVIDVMPTVLEAARIPQPASVNGVIQQEVNGASFLSTLLNANAPEYHTSQYFEMHGNRAMYSDGWVAAQRTGLLPWAYTSGSNAAPPAWELYDLTRDYSEANNLASRYPEKLAELQKLFEAEGARNKVFPIHPRVSGRQHLNPPPPGGRE